MGLLAGLDADAVEAAHHHYGTLSSQKSCKTLFFRLSRGAGYSHYAAISMRFSLQVYKFFTKVRSQKCQPHCCWQERTCPCFCAVAIQFGRHANSIRSEVSAGRCSESKKETAKIMTLLTFLLRLPGFALRHAPSSSSEICQPL